MKNSNQHLTTVGKFQSWDTSRVRSPKVAIIYKKAMKLSQIPVIFKIADFERIKADKHIRDIARSIVDNTFFDPVIRVIKRRDDWYVIDGQHRLAALYLLFKDFGLETYDLIVLEYPEQNARTIYRKNNLTKPLNLSHHLKAIDTKRQPFFNELREFLSHNDNSKLLTFAEIIRCHNYAATGIKGLNVPLEDIVAGVTEQDIEHIVSFVRGMTNTMPTKQKGDQFRMSFMMSCYYASYKKKLNQVEIGNLILKGLKNTKIINSLGHNTKADLELRTQLFYQEVATLD